MWDAADGRNDVLRERETKAFGQKPDISGEGIIDQKQKTSMQQANIFAFFPLVTS